MFVYTEENPKDQREREGRASYLGLTTTERHYNCRTVLRAEPRYRLVEERGAAPARLSTMMSASGLAERA